MFKLIAVSNRHICRGDFYERLREISCAGAEIILREKDMTKSQYDMLLDAVKNPNIIPHTFVAEAKKHGFKRMHLPLNMLRENPQLSKDFKVGVSIHSPQEAVEAQNSGAVYVTAGHIFETNCKKGLPGRGLELIQRVKESVHIPVYAIGGINEENIIKIKDAGADGACIMSGFMCCENVSDKIRRINKLCTI